MTINYPNAPIIEALIEAWPILDKPPDLKILNEIIEDLPQDYEQSHKIINTNIKVEFAEKESKESIQSSTEQLGYFRKSSDEKYIAQITTNFFTFNRLAPYKSGDDLLEHFSKVWDCYTKKIKVKRFRKIGVRFINVFEIPIGQTEKTEETVDSEDYIKIDIEVKGPEEFQYFETKKEVTLASKKYDAYCNVKLFIKPADGKAKCTFDITAFKTNITINNFTEFKKVYKNLRALKNEIFELNLTDKLKDSFKHE